MRPGWTEPRRGSRSAVPENAFVVAAAARLSREKGLDTLLAAAGQRAGMTFLLAGDGPLKPALARKTPPNANLLGRLDDVRPLLAAADVFAVPSRREGQGIAALEAMAAGVPVVAAASAAWPTCWPTAKPPCWSRRTTRMPSPPPSAASRATPACARNSSRTPSPLVRERYDLRAMLDAVTEVYREVWPTTRGLIRGIIGSREPRRPPMTPTPRTAQNSPTLLLARDPLPPLVPTRSMMPR